MRFVVLLIKSVYTFCSYIGFLNANNKMIFVGIFTFTSEVRLVVGFAQPVTCNPYRIV